MKQGKREPKRDSDKERERQSEREDYIQVQIVLCKRGVWPARQLDSVILCEARFKNFNSPTAVQLSVQTMRPAYENSRVFCCAKLLRLLLLLSACCKPKASILAAVCQAAMEAAN